MNNNKQTTINYCIFFKFQILPQVVFFIQFYILEKICYSDNNYILPVISIPIPDHPVIITLFIAKVNIWQTLVPI